MTLTSLDRRLVAGDAGRVTGERQERPDPEVPERARRRTFTAQYKQQVLAAYEAAPDGEKGAVLRREGLYSSLISEWRRARDAGALAGLKQPVGRPAADPRDAEIARLRKEKAKLEQELATSRFVVDVQSKLHAGRRSPRARTPGKGRSPDRRGRRRHGTADRHPGRLPRSRRRAGDLAPSAPDQPAGTEGGRGPAQRPDPAAGADGPPSGPRS